MGRETKETYEERKRERDGLLRATNWNNGNWLTSNEYSIGLPTFEQGNERKILGLHWSALIRQDNEGCVCNLRHTMLSYSLHLPQEKGTKREWNKMEQEGVGVMGPGY